MNEGLSIMASNCQIDVAVVEQTLRKTAFASCRSNEEFYAMVSVANAYNLNPFLKEIYAFPSRGGGVVPIVGVDGWLKMVNAHPQFDGLEINMSEDGKECECSIHRKDRSKPITCTEYLAECVVAGSGPWRSHPRRMLRHKAIMQCARIAFGFSGIYDEDEADRRSEYEGAALRDAAPKKPLFGEPKVQEPVAEESPSVKPRRKAKAVDKVAPGKEPLSDAIDVTDQVGETLPDDVEELPKGVIIENIQQSIAELGADAARVLAYAGKQTSTEYGSFDDIPHDVLRQLDAALVTRVKNKYGDQ